MVYPRPTMSATVCLRDIPAPFNVQDIVVQARAQFGIDAIVSFHADERNVYLEASSRLQATTIVRDRFLRLQVRPSVLGIPRYSSSFN